VKPVTPSLGGKLGEMSIRIKKSETKSSCIGGVQKGVLRCMVRASKGKVKGIR